MEQMALAMANVQVISASDDMTVTTEDDDYDDDDAYEEKEAFDDDDWFEDDDAYEEKESFDDDDWFDDDDGDVGATPVNDNNDNTYAGTNENSDTKRSVNIVPISIS